MESASQVQTLDESVCFSLSIITLGKGMNPTIQVRQTGLFDFGMATSLEKGKLWIQICYTPFNKLILCHILLVYI